jgi:ferredoxin-NADP reductase
LARYTGIVPFRAMLLHLLAHPPEAKVTLVYSARRPEDLAYHAELLRAAEAQPWFELIALVDEPDQAGEYGRMGVWEYGSPSTPQAPTPPHSQAPRPPHSNGAVLDLLPELVRLTAPPPHHPTTSPPHQLIPMVCGVREFVRPIRDYFYDLGYDRKAVKWENYD